MPEVIHSTLLTLRWMEGVLQRNEELIERSRRAIEESRDLLAKFAKVSQTIPNGQSVEL
jgi:hypothetical protein